jgi:transcription initiation factor TFIIIB Brf1 subunit/transcription initiation factor TFIIB
MSFEPLCILNFIMFMSARPQLETGSCYCGTNVHHIFDPLSSVDVCQQCGVVVEQVLDDTPDYAYDDDGTNNGFHGLDGYSTYIDDKSALSKRLQASLMTTDEKLMRDRREVVTIICDAFKIPKENVIFDTTISIASMHHDKVKLSGRKKVALIAAAFYFSCKIHHAARDARTVANVCGLDIKILNFGIKSIRENLSDSQYMSTSNGNTSTNHNLAEQFIAMLDIDNDTMKTLRKNVWNMIDTLADSFDSGRKPRTVVSAMIVINMFQLSISFDKKEVATKFGVCSQSIDSCIRSLKKEYNLQF